MTAMTASTDPTFSIADDGIRGPSSPNLPQLLDDDPLNTPPINSTPHEQAYPITHSSITPPHYYYYDYHGYQRQQKKGRPSRGGGTAGIA